MLAHLSVQVFISFVLVAERAAAECCPRAAACPRATCPRRSTCPHTITTREYTLDSLQTGLFIPTSKKAAVHCSNNRKINVIKIIEKSLPHNQCTLFVEAVYEKLEKNSFFSYNV